MNIRSYQRERLEKLYLQSQQRLHDAVASVKSSTLEELFKSEYQISDVRSSTTLVKNLKTNKPEKILIKGEIISNNPELSYHRRCYEATNSKGQRLGFKTFGITKNQNTDEYNFEPGLIKSFKNNKYAGVQIRLLQVMCELAEKLKIRTIPLISEPQAVVFHTKMGFIPTEKYNTEVQSINVVKDKLSILREAMPRIFKDLDYNPVLSKLQGKYFFDFNRTIYLTMLDFYMNKMTKNGKKHFPRSYQTEDVCIDMYMPEKILNEWTKNLHGFEILPEDEKLLCPTKSFWERIRERIFFLGF